MAEWGKWSPAFTHTLTQIFQTLSPGREVAQALLALQ